MNQNSSHRALLVLCTCPDTDIAATLANNLVNQRLAACVNIQESVRSIYRWEGEVTEDTECLLMIKTTTGRFAAVETFLLNEHPYELPEMLAVPIEKGSAAYLSWIRDSVSLN